MTQSRVPRSTLIWLLTILVALAATTPGTARADEESGWRIRVDFAFVDPTGDLARVEVTPLSARVEFDAGAGFGIRGEYQFSRRVGIDFGVLTTASVGVSTSAAGVAEVDFDTFTPLTVGADFHLTPGKRVDLYLGPQLALVSYGDVDVNAGPLSASTAVSVDNDLGIGVIVGLDVPLGQQRHWAFQTSLRYLSTSMAGDDDADPFDVDFDPVIFSVGFGYRW